MIAKLLEANSRYLALVILSIIVVGYTSLNGMARKEDPAITPFFAKVQIVFPGASPERVETLITKPMVDALREEPDVKEVDGTSASGVSLIFMEIDYRLPKDRLAQIWSELRDKIDEVAATLPPGALPPDFDDELWTEFVKIIAISGADGRTLPPAQLRRQALQFADAARGVPLTRRVMLYGLPKEEVRVELEETKLSSLGISIDQVAAALSRADARAPAGKLTGNNASLTVELTGEFTNLESVRNVIVRALPDGRSIRVSDLAEVRKSEVTPFESLSLSNGQRSVLIGVEMQRGFRSGWIHHAAPAECCQKPPNGCLARAGSTADHAGLARGAGSRRDTAAVHPHVHGRTVLFENSDSTNVCDRTGCGPRVAGGWFDCHD
jgi:multidrug efflux pump subunit AcrB